MTIPLCLTRRACALVASLAVAALLAGCGSGDGPNNSNFVGKVTRGAIGAAVAKRTAGPGGVTASDAELRNFGKPLLILTNLQTRRDAVIGVASNRDGNVIWKSTDGLTLTLRDGLVVASRGYPGDLMSADEPDVRRGSGEVVRDHYYIGGNELIQRSRFFCTLTTAGQDRVVVTGVASTARLVVENCAGDGVAFENRYWIEPGGTIRKSIQWIGPDLGSFRIEAVPQGRAANVRTDTPVAGVRISE